MNIVKTSEDVKRLAETYDFTTISFDTETNSVHGAPAPYTDLVIEGLSIYNGKEAFYCDLFENPQTQEILELFKHIFSTKVKTLICHNIVFDLKVLYKYGITCNHLKIYDTMIADHLLNEEGEHGLKYLANSVLNALEPITYEKAIQTGKHSDPFYNYALNDAIWAYKLAKHQQTPLKDQGLVDLFRNIEMPFVFVLLDMEIHGFKVDKHSIYSTTSLLVSKIEELEVQMLHTLNIPYKVQLDLHGKGTIVSLINFNSGQHLSKILYTQLQLPIVATTDKGMPSTGKEALETLKDKHPFVKLLWQYKIAQKLHSAFFNPMPKYIQRDGRVRSHFNPVGTATGRLSCSSPNLQQLPKIKADFPVDTRKCFIVDDDEIMITSDYSGQELRILAHISQEPNLVAAFNKGQDLHLATAKAMLGCDIPDEALYETHPDYEKYKKKYKDERNKAKIINFGIAFGKGSFGFSQDFGISEDEAQGILDKYFNANPGVRKAIDSTTAFVKRNGYVASITGRRRRFTPKQDEKGNKYYPKAAFRQAFNFLIQGYASDMIRLASIKCYDLKQKHPEWHMKFLASVHDEVVFSVKKQYEQQAKIAIKEAFETAVTLAVPVVANVESGKDYGSAK